MTAGTHAVVWIDNAEARTVLVDHQAVVRLVEHSHNAAKHLHSRSGSREGYRATADHVFFQRVANELAGAQSFKIIGPANAKTELAKHIRRFDPHLYGRLSAIESVERMTDPELEAFARGYFERADRMILMEPMSDSGVE
jgi:hypothetical protein